MDERDYDRRLTAYPRLNPTTWAALLRLQALPLVHQALADLRDADDLALRHAASRALADLISAAAAADLSPSTHPNAALRSGDISTNPSTEPSGLSGGATAGQRADLGLLVQRVLFPQIKRSLGASNLAVRQVRVQG